MWLPLLGLRLDLRFDAGVFELLASLTVMFTVLGLEGWFTGGSGDDPLKYEYCID